MLQTDWKVAENLARIQQRIAEVALRVGRGAEEITVVAVSKTQPVDAVVAAIGAGLVHFGENRVQEAANKIPSIKRRPDSQATLFHMLGHLQRNKVGSAVGLFDYVDSLDSLPLAQALGRHVVSEGRDELAVRLEVYVGDNPGRPGVRPEELMDTAGQILEVRGLRIEGLMTVAPLGGDARAAFAQVRALRDQLAQAFPRVHFGVLSMGMSDDYVSAIQEGSTEVRVGTALFGPRRE